MSKEAKNITSRRDVLKSAGVALAGVAAASVPGTGALAEAAAKPTAPRWVMIMDLRKCTGCRACTVACKSEFNTPLGRFRAVIQQAEYGAFPETKKGFLPLMCNHCAGLEESKLPPCVMACPEYPTGKREYATADGQVIGYDHGATYKRPDGMILVDNSLCIGCGACIEACPYGVRSFQPHVQAGKDPEKNGIEKCSMCEHRVDQGIAPSCVNTCVGRARIFGDINDPDSEVSKLAKEWNLLEKREETTLLPDQGTNPQVFYIDPDNLLSKVYRKRKAGVLDHYMDQFV
jgi:tetrathionate reductase subunit B